MAIKSPKAWVVTVDMGYGHQRAAYPLRKLAYKGIINANHYPFMPSKDRNTWRSQREFYEKISKFKNFPLIGEIVWKIFDYFQRIPKFYPRRDLSDPTLQLRGSISLIKKGWGKHLIEKISTKKLPLITPFFLPAMMAEIHGFPGDIYCLLCDADVSRSWASAIEPKTSRIKFLAPCQRVFDRLKLYGVPEERIFLTGFPLPQENLGSLDFGVAKKDLRHRLVNLDPERKFISNFKETLEATLNMRSFPKTTNHPLTITFAVGGAAAQKDLGVAIVRGLAKQIKRKKIRIFLIAGVHHQVKTFFEQKIAALGLKKHLDKEIKILYEPDKQNYIKKFNQWLHQTDILWTKPSELSFYCALGLPIIIADPIGSQEEFNRNFLVDIGAGIVQDDIRYVDEWLFDWIKNGRLAEAAAKGFLEAPKMGVYNIEKVISKHLEEVKKIKTITTY